MLGVWTAPPPPFCLHVRPFSQGRDSQPRVRKLNFLWEISHSNNYYFQFTTFVRFLCLGRPLYRVWPKFSGGVWCGLTPCVFSTPSTPLWATPPWTFLPRKLASPSDHPLTWRPTPLFTLKHPYPFRPASGWGIPPPLRGRHPNNYTNYFNLSRFWGSFTAIFLAWFFVWAQFYFSVRILFSVVLPGG